MSVNEIIGYLGSTLVLCLICGVTCYVLGYNKGWDDKGWPKR